MTKPTRLVVAQVRGVHGLRGVVRVEVLTDRPEERFSPGSVLHREGSDATLTVISAAPVEDGPGWRLGFREVRDRSAADRLRDAYLETDVDRDVDLRPDELYWHEVVGLRVRGTSGRDLGVVDEVYRVGETEAYAVRGGTAGDFDMPAIRDVIREISRERRELVVDDGVLDLEAPVIDAATTGKKRRPRWSRHGKGGTGPSDTAAGEPRATPAQGEPDDGETPGSA